MSKKQQDKSSIIAKAPAQEVIIDPESDLGQDKFKSYENSELDLDEDGDTVCPDCGEKMSDHPSEDDEPSPLDILPEKEAIVVAAVLDVLHETITDEELSNDIIGGILCSVEEWGKTIGAISKNKKH